MSALDDAWQAALAAEHEGVFGYGLLGARLDARDHPLGKRCQGAHAALRDRTAVALLAAGQQPVAAQADYPSLYPVPDAASARRLAVRLEDACCVAWRVLYLQAASSTSAAATAIRTSAQDALTASAVRATQWRALSTPSNATVAFPGI